MTDLRVDREGDLIGHEQLDGLRSAEGDRQSTPSAAPGVPLSRLLALARLAPAQALEVGAGLLAALVERPEADAGTVVTERIRIDGDGRVVLETGSAHGNQTSVAGVLGELAGAARERADERDPAAEGLLAELDRATAEVQATGVRAAACRLQQACDGIDRAAVCAELAALVGALLASASGAGGAAPGHPAGGRRERTAAVPPAARTRGTARRVWAWLLSITVLVSVVALEVALLRDDIVADVNLLLEAGRSSSAPPATEEPDGLPVQPPAPPSAGSVAGVDLRLLQACTPGTTCAIRVFVRLVPTSDPQAVAWSFRLMDRCTGATITAPGGTLTVPAGAGQAAAVGTVALPEWAAAALVAVTDRPAVAAAAPVLVGTCGSAVTRG
ncbi:MAG: hypothetical protein K0R87_2554 [Pseudonocardia sp.]|nr:hypothetical protein [Pseudonocardia sp.]